MAEEEPFSGERRCNRTDGRRWRCKRPAKEGNLLCEIHFEQVRLRNGKIKVPDSLKLQRSGRRTSNKNPSAAQRSTEESEIRANGREHLDRKTKRKRSSSAADADDLTEKNAKREADELLSSLAKRKNKGLEQKKNKKNAEKQCSEEITKELPFGRMAISALPESKSIGNADSSAVKLGSYPTNFRLVDRRFRSKNIEQPPISTLKAVPYAGNRKGKVKNAGAQGGRKKCHWCQRSRNISLNKCLSCNKRFFCSVCMKERSIEVEELRQKCPVCQGTCECNACSISHQKDTNSEDNLKKQGKISKYSSLHYMISLVLPILEQINEEQTIELEIEAKLKEQSLSEVEIRQAEFGDKQICCNKCSSLILDMHRSCSNCSYNLCLSCCQETRALILQDREKSFTGDNANASDKISKKSMQNDSSSDNDSVDSISSSGGYNGNLLCPSLDHGGCSNSSSALDLRCVFPLNYTRELEVSAKEIILREELPKILDPSLQCSLCSSMAREGSKKGLLDASRRKHPGDNFLYCVSIRDEHDILLHFQKHWRNYNPVVFRDLLEKASALTWDPISMFSSFLKMEETFSPNCKDWYKVEFSNKESFSGMPMKVVNSSYETLKLKAKLSSFIVQRLFSAQFAEILNVLPIQEYTNPKTGLLNIAANLEEDPQVSEFGPHIHITCGNAGEVRKGELFNELSYHPHDLVNILVHASDFSPSKDQVNKIKTLVRMKNLKNTGGSNGLDLDNGITDENGVISNSNAKAQASEAEEMPCGIQWDVFRRQDASKLVEYIQKHSDELYDIHDSSKQAVYSILDGSFFLDSAHKMKLKHEFRIEPWTINQKIGEAVFIPAGCPYQTTYVKSCVNVVMEFVSPENAGECIKLAEASRVKVRKMVINKISKAIEEMRIEAEKQSS